MLFGKRKPEEVSIEKLNQFLNSQFEKKLGQLGSRAQTITDTLNHALLKFGVACDSFEKLDVEPHVEGRYAVNINSIKTQKGRYASSLKQILGSTHLETDGAANSYDKYRYALSNLEAMIKMILEANANFKIVLYCYSNYLWDFKSLFSEIERHTGELKSELNNKSDEFSEYRALSEKISKLNKYLEDLEALNKSMEMLKIGAPHSDESDSDKSHSDASRLLGEKTEELAKLSRERASLHDRITSLTLPLERASKKLDYLSAGKKKLHAFVENPIDTINMESDYAEFRSLVQELNKKIHEGGLDLKNSDKMGETVSLLLNSDIYSMINSFKSCRRDEQKIAEEISALERRISAIKNEKSASERHAQELIDLEAKVKEIEQNRTAEKRTIEKSFQDTYGILISIVD